jgi:hypothetical protein
MEEAVSGSSGFSGGGGEPAAILPVSREPVVAAARQQRHRADATGISPESESSSCAADRGLLVECVFRVVGQRQMKLRRISGYPTSEAKKKLCSGKVLHDFTGKMRYLLFYRFRDTNLSLVLSHLH